MKLFLVELKTSPVIFSLSFYIHGNFRAVRTAVNIPNMEFALELQSGMNLIENCENSLTEEE